MTPPPSIPWHLGQKVVCLNDIFPTAVQDWCAYLPRVGCVYTIRALQIGRDRLTGQPSLGFLLAECVNPLSSLGKEAGFVAARFQPWLTACSETLRQREIEALHYENTGL